MQRMYFGVIIIKILDIIMKMTDVVRLIIWMLQPEI